MPIKKTATVKSPVPKKKVSSPKPALKAVKFELHAPHAKTVYIAGCFNQWNPTDTPLKLDKKTGVWKISLKLKADRYLYKFIVDGEWWSDPANPNWQWNNYGSHDSILVIQ